MHPINVSPFATLSSAELRRMSKDTALLPEIQYHAARLIGEAPNTNPFDRWTSGDLLIYADVAHTFAGAEWRLLGFACRAEFKRRRSDQEAMHGGNFFKSDKSNPIPWRNSPPNQSALVL